MNAALRSGAGRAGALLAALLLVAAATGAEVPASGPEAGRDVESLLAGMAGSRGVVARFHEVKRLALLEEPLESRGVLYFVPPDRMVRITLAPLHTALVVDGARIAFHDGGRPEPVDLSREPTARQFVENFSVLFGADVDALRQRYELAYAPPEGSAGWHMQLVPRSPLVRRVIRQVELQGDLQAIRRIAIEESDGDLTTTEVSPVDVDREFSEAELERLFQTPLAEGALPALGGPEPGAPQRDGPQPGGAAPGPDARGTGDGAP